MVGIRAKLKLAKFDRHFSQYNFEKLIQTLLLPAIGGLSLAY